MTSMHCTFRRFTVKSFGNYSALISGIYPISVDKMTAMVGLGLERR